MELRQARPEDAEALEAVRVAGWRTAYRGLLPDALLDGLEVDLALVAQRAAVLADPPPSLVVLLAESDDGVVGFGWFSAARDDDLDPEVAAELLALYVAPGVWSRGLGGQLLEEGFGRLPHPLQVLWTLEGNARARRFYERRGFVADGASTVRDLAGPAVEVRYRRARPAQVRPPDVRPGPARP